MDDINEARKALGLREKERKETQMNLENVINFLAGAGGVVLLSGIVGFGFALGVRFAGGF